MSPDPGQQPEPPVLGWARELLDGPVTAELVRDRPWSRTWVMTAGGHRFFLKKTGPASHYEAPLTQQLAGLAPGYIPPVLGADAGHGWLLMADAGPTLEALAERNRSAQPDASAQPGSDGAPPLDVERWEQFVARFAQLQRQAEPLTTRLLEAGVPDERPERLGLVLAELLATSPQLGGLTPSERRQLASVASSWSADLELIGSVPIPASVEHGDLHDNNVSLGPDGQPVFLDFGDASIAHPFTTMFVPLMLAGTRGTDSDVDRITSAYLAQYTHLAPLPSLRAVLEAVLRLSWVSRATGWERALVSAPPGHQWGDPVAGALRNLLVNAPPAVARNTP